MPILRYLILSLLRLCFRFRIFGQEHLEAKGPLVVSANHISWIDALILTASVDSTFRFVGSKNVAESSKFLGFAMKIGKAYLIDPASPSALREVIRYLQQGGKIVIFPEGSISDTKNMRKFYDGIGFLLHKSEAKVIPCIIRGAENSIFARQCGPKQLFPKIEIHFGEAIAKPKIINKKASVARGLTTNWLRKQMIDFQFFLTQKLEPNHLLTALEKTAKEIKNKIILEDMTGSKLTLPKLLLSSSVLAKVLARKLTTKQGRVALLLPTANAAPLCLACLWRLKLVPAILNFSSGPKIMLDCINLAGISEVITSRSFLEKGKIDIGCFIAAGIKVFYLEEIKTQISFSDKIGSLIASITPIAAIITSFSTPRDPQATAAILFTSGSEGVPKGVELSHINILSNIRQISLANDLVYTDRFFNSLPVFHSFGLTGGTLAPLLLGNYAFLYPSPLHYRTIPAIIYDKNCTVIISTNTFLNGYARRANPYDFHTVRRAYVGAEKVQEETARIWAQVFDVRILEGYGATECAPVISMNSPFELSFNSVGTLLPGMEYRIEPVEGYDKGGRFWVRGPNIMKGYVNSEANEVFKKHGGWYDTGDIVAVDDSGFLSICGRAKRFAKISGEMISLGAVEEALNKHLAKNSDSIFEYAITAYSSKEKGEILVASTTDSSLCNEQIREAIVASGLPTISIPKVIIKFSALPKLGIGKTDFVTLAKQVTEHMTKESHS